MKKIYMQPELIEFNIAVQPLMAGSDITFSEDGETGTGKLNDVEAEGPGMSRGRGFWDDED